MMKVAFRKLPLAFPCLYVILGMVLAIAVTGCTTIARQFVEEPKVSLNGVGVRELSSKGATVVFNVNVDNPNPYRMVVDDLTYEVEVGGKSLANGKFEHLSAIEGNSNSEVEIPIALKYADVFNSLVGFAQKGQSTYRVRGVALIGIFSIPFDHEGEFKLKE